MPNGQISVVASPTRSRRREATRQRLLDAARDVFAERGVIGASVEDICERAGFTRGAFYSNFTDKDAVVEALIEREHGRLVDDLDANFASFDPMALTGPDPVAALTAVVDRVLGSVPVDWHLSLVQTEMEIHAIRAPGGSSAFRAADDRFRARIAAFITDAMTRHGRVLLVDPGVLTDAAIGIMERSVRRSLLSGDGSDPDRMARAVLPILFLAASRPVGP
jgi:AcrR family transcriptional regulator